MHARQALSHQDVKFQLSSLPSLGNLELAPPASVSQVAKAKGLTALYSFTGLFKPPLAQEAVLPLSQNPVFFVLPTSSISAHEYRPGYPMVLLTASLAFCIIDLEFTM